MITPLPPGATRRPAPVFTLGPALLWFGHDSPGMIGGLTASVCFLRGGRRLLGQPPEALVPLDPSDTGNALARTRRMIFGVDCGTRGHAIHLRHRRQGEHGPVLAVPRGIVLAGNGIELRQPTVGR